jgi:hypothetical protein
VAPKAPGEGPEAQNSPPATSTRRAKRAGTCCAPGLGELARIDSASHGSATLLIRRIVPGVRLFFFEFLAFFPEVSGALRRALSPLCCFLAQARLGRFEPPAHSKKSLTPRPPRQPRRTAERQARSDGREESPSRGRRFRAELAAELPEHSKLRQDERARRLPPAASSTLRALLKILLPLLLLLRRSSRRRGRRRICGAEGAGRSARGAELAAGCWCPSRAARRNSRCSVSCRASSGRQRFPRLGRALHPSAVPGVRLFFLAPLAVLA